MLCESRNTVFILSCLMLISQIEALLAQTSFSFLAIFLPVSLCCTLGALSLSSLYVAEWSSLLPLYQTLCFNVLGFHLVLLMKDHLFVSSACYLFWRDRSFAYISCAKINTLSLLKEGRRPSPFV